MLEQPVEGILETKASGAAGLDKRTEIGLQWGNKCTFTDEKEKKTKKISRNLSAEKMFKLV